MERVALSDIQLDYLAYNHPTLQKYYGGTRACDRLPSTLSKQEKKAYIVNTDPHDKPGTHWLAIWTEENYCEMMDSFALSFDIHPESMPLQQWIQRHFEFSKMNSIPLQSIQSDSCGDYALFYLIDKSNGYSMEHFLNRFKRHDFVWNDHHVGQMLKNYIKHTLDEDLWKRESVKHYKQRNK